MFNPNPKLTEFLMFCNRAFLFDILLYYIIINVLVQATRRGKRKNSERPSEPSKNNRGFENVSLKFQ